MSEKRKKYDREFREGAVRIVEETGKPIAQVARDPEVVGTIRSRSKADATRSAIASVAAVDKLSFVEADLLAGAGWDEAMRGVTYVCMSPCPEIASTPGVSKPQRPPRDRAPLIDARHARKQLAPS